MEARKVAVSSSHGNSQQCLLSGRGAHAWDARARHAWPVAVVNLLSAQGGELSRAHSSGEAT